MSNRNISIFIVLQPTKLVVVTQKGESVLSFPLEIVQHQEILQLENFQKLIYEFFSKIGKHTTSVFLDYQLLYEQIIPIDQKLHTFSEDAIQTFFEKVPFHSSKTTQKYIATSTKLALFATNGELYRVIIEQLESLGWRVPLVLPLSAFVELNNTQSFTYTLGKKILSQDKLVTSANFLQLNDYERRHEKTEEASEERNKITPRQYVTLAISLLFFAGAIIFAVVQLKLLPIKLYQEKVTIIPTPTMSNNVLPTATPEISIKKTDITFQVLNGSGIVGEANSIQSQLVASGFTNLEIGNAQGVGSATTIAIFSGKVSQAYQNEITQILNKTFTSVDVQQVASPGAFDVFITLGQGVH